MEKRFMCTTILNGCTMDTRHILSGLPKDIGKRRTMVGVSWEYRGSIVEVSWKYPPF